MKTKIILLVIATLLLGMVVGFSASSFMTKHRMHKMMERQRPENIEKHLLGVIEPSAEQKDSVLIIIRNHAEDMKSIRRLQVEQSKNSFQDMMKELEPLLDEEQMGRMKDLQKRIQRGDRKGKKPPRH
jgi:hypothetical protein